MVVLDAARCASLREVSQEVWVAGFHHVPLDAGLGCVSGGVCDPRACPSPSLPSLRARAAPSPSSRAWSWGYEQMLSALISVIS